MQPSNLLFAWLRIIECPTHQQQDTLRLKALVSIWKQAFLASSKTAFFRVYLQTHYLNRLSHPKFALLSIRQTSTSRSRT
ncbi:hypothetical protein H6G64_36645 [Calothrix sp. FACHB-156]|nr:hypothetical protein [Nostoc linckia FACHB-104]MBD2342436.1 hypothetical protein [Calothrix sp. FACHB-156]